MDDVRIEIKDFYIKWDPMVDENLKGQVVADYVYEGFTEEEREGWRSVSWLLGVNLTTEVSTAKAEEIERLFEEKARRDKEPKKRIKCYMSKPKPDGGFTIIRERDYVTYSEEEKRRWIDVDVYKEMTDKEKVEWKNG